MAKRGASLRGRIAIVGIAELAEPAGARSPAGMMADAARLAIADAGVRKDQIDGLFATTPYYYAPTLTFAEYFGLAPRYTDSSVLGGCSFEAYVGHAAAAIETGLCDYALITYGSTQRSDGRALVSGSEWLEYERPYGMMHPISPIAMIAARHMHQYGSTSEQFAHAAVAAREWSRLNPRAPYRDRPLTIDDVLSSPLISTPVHKLDCCLVTDGAAALVITSAERARELPTVPAFVLGFGEASDHRNITGMTDLTVTRAVDSAQRAFEMSGLTPQDVDVAEVYDAFTMSLAVLLEDIGFCAKGDGGALLESGATRPGGSLPLNTNGGGLSFVHPGMLGAFLLTEAVQQLRGDAGARQVTGARTAVAHGMGFTLGGHATVVLGAAETL
ncbi:acetyl-CoA acetyltransferase [Gryllotalpicola reticulitermitis]|uniref:Acetyl-CoA acetyltransferase n=1 Tax=Gryllotalpicola reticulitermitis TaxID=1184153 RepID=A0ABV8Q493_9MICO